MAMDNSGVPTESVRDFCRQYPNRNVPNSANGTAFDWTCRGTNPVITGRTPVDERGYFKDAWRKIAVSDPPEKQVRQFVEELYSRRARPGRRSYPGPALPDVFTTSLVKLLTENRKLLNGDLGALDFDPFCQCQDDGGLKATIRKVSLYGIENATVDVDLLFPGGSRDSVRLALEEEQNHWRVRDVQSKKMESMRNALFQENKKLAASQTPPSSGSPSTATPGPNPKPNALTAMPQGTRVVVDCIYIDHPSNGYGTTFRMAVPVGIDKLQSPDFAISLLNAGMQEAIKYCNDNFDKRKNVLDVGKGHLDASNRFFSRICNIPCESAVIGDDVLISATKEIGTNKWQVTNYATAIYQRQQKQTNERESAPVVDIGTLCTFLRDGQASLRALTEQARAEANPLRQANAGEAFRRRRDELNARLNELLRPNYKFEGVQGEVASIEAQVYSQGPAANLSISVANCPMNLGFRFIDWNGNWGKPGDDMASLSKWRSVLESIVTGTPVVFSAVLLKDTHESRYFFPADDGRLGLGAMVTELRKK